MSPGRPEQVATAIVFFTTGFGMAVWAPLVPFAKAHAGLGDGVLGLLLLCLGIGSIATMPLAGAGAARYGCRAVLVVSTVLMCAALPVLATASGLVPLAAAMLVFGAGVGACDVTMNIQAIIVERAAGRAIMSRFHAMFSLGGIAGAAGIAALLSAGVAPLTAMLAVVAAIAVAVAAGFAGLLPYGSRGDGPVFALPRGIVLFIGMLCFIAFLTEGSVLDWSAVFLTSIRGAAMEAAGFGYAAFSVTMTIGRLSGDFIVERCGGANVIAFGASLAAIGFLLAIAVPSWEAALFGYALVGAGCSNIVPVLFSSVGRQTVMPEHVAVPAITTLGYAGILAGPAAIGLIAHAASLAAAFAILSIMLVGVAVGGRILRAEPGAAAAN